MRTRACRNVIPIVLIALSFIAPRARADVTITEENEDLSTGMTVTTRIFLAADRVRVESGEGQSFTFRGDLEVFWIVDESGGTYMEMTREDIERLGERMAELSAQMEQVQRQMEEQLASMPAAQRRMIEEAMAGGGGLPGMPGMGPMTAPVAETEFALVSSGESVGQWTADLYEGTQDGAKRWDVWAVDFSEVGLAMSDFAAFESLAEMIQQMVPSGQGMDDLFQVEASGDGEGYSGVPVRRISYRDGEPESRYEMTEINRDPIAPSMFELPEGLSRQSMPEF
jgi:hypothetical protein